MSKKLIAKEFTGKAILDNAALKMVCDHSKPGGVSRCKEAGTITFSQEQYETFLKVIEESIDDAVAAYNR